MFGRQGFPIEPPADGPGPGIAFAGRALGEGQRQPQRKKGCEPWKPLVFLVHRPNAPGRRGRRAANSPPRRYIALSVPSERTGSMSSWAHCGNWAVSRRRTKDASVLPRRHPFWARPPCCGFADRDLRRQGGSLSGGVVWQTERQLHPKPVHAWAGSRQQGGRQSGPQGKFGGSRGQHHQG